MLLLAAALAWAQKAAPDAAAYTITIHVQASRLSDSCGGNPAVCSTAQRLTVLIDGKKYELEAAGGNVLRVGDYRAKMTKDETKRAAEYERVYEFLFADGTTRKYDVVGEGE